MANVTVARHSMQGVREDCRKIGALLASGFSPADVREELKLSSRSYKLRMAMIRRRAYNHVDVFPRFMAKVETRYRQLEAIRQRAITLGKLDTALRAIEDMRRLDREIIEVGAELGVYQTQPKQVNHLFEAPTLGMFHAADPEAIDVTPEEDQLDSQAAE